MPQKTSKPWFAPKQFGYGTGLPICWQGWLAFALYLVVVGATPLAIVVWPKPSVALPAMLAVIVFASAGFFVLCAKKTDGGWRWRGKP